MHRTRRTTSRVLLLLPLVLATLPDRAANAGYGGVDAVICSTGSTTCAYNIGKTNTTSPYNWSYFSGSWNTCTHAYPYNDLYENNAYAFTTFTFSSSDASSNCNRVVLYLDGAQGGGGAVNCYRSQVSCTPGGTYHSISWHNR